MKKYILLFLLVASVTAQAQVPGYMGKKNSFGYEPSFGVAFKSFNSKFNSSSLFIFPEGWEGNTDPKHVKLFALNLTHTFIYDRIIKRNASFTASFSIFKSGILFDGYSVDVYDPINFSHNSQYVSGGTEKISGFAINIGYRRYRNQLAPLGLYTGYSLGFASSSAMVHSSSTDTTLFTKAKVLTPKFCYIYGRQNVFFDKLIIDRGFSFDMFGFLLGFIAKNKGNDNNGVGSSNTPESVFTYQLKARMYYRDMVTFYIGGKYMF